MSSRSHAPSTRYGRVIALACLVAATRTRGQEYHVARRVVLDSAGADFFAVDPVGRRLYGAGDYVIDVDHDSVVGTLPPHTGHGFALAPDLGRGIGRRGVIFDLSTLKEIGRVSASGDASTYDPISRRAVLFEDTTTVVDVASGTVVGKIQLGHGLESGVADSAGLVYVNVSSSDSLLAFDPATLAVRHRWPLAPCHSPQGLSIDRARRRLFASCDNGMMVVVDADRGTVVATVPVGGRADANAYDPGTGLILNPNGNGTMTVVLERSANTYRVLPRVATVEGANAVTIDPKTHDAFLFQKQGKALTVIVLRLDATSSGRAAR